MVSLVFVLCELVIQVLQLISCSQNMTLAFVKNAIYARVLTRKFTRYFVTRKCEKKSFFLTEKTFYEFPLTIGTSFLEINCKFLCKFLPSKSRVPNCACL